MKTACLKLRTTSEVGPSTVYSVSGGARGKNVSPLSRYLFISLCPVPVRIYNGKSGGAWSCSFVLRNG